MNHYTEWKPEDLLQQQQVVATAYIAMTLSYLESLGIPLDDFIRFMGEQVAPNWTGAVGNAADMLNAILINVRASGGQIIEARLQETQSAATVTRLLDHKTGQGLGVSASTLDRFWDSFQPIARAAGMQFSWTKDHSGNFRIEVSHNQQ